MSHLPRCPVTSCCFIIYRYNVNELCLQPQSPLVSSFHPVGSFPSDNLSQYPHNDSAYVSPGSVFGEMGNVSLVSGSPSEMNLSPSTSSPSLFASPEYHCFPAMRDFPATSQTANRGVLSHESMLSFPLQSRLSYAG